MLRSISNKIGILISTSGLIIVAYTLVAMMSGYPQLSDLFPVDLFQDTSDKYFKIIPSIEASYIDYYVIGIGLFLIVIGFVINKLYPLINK